MNKTSKILVIIAIVVFWLILSIFNAAAMKEAGNKAPGIIGILLLVGMIAAVRAVWKHSPNENGKKQDNSKHQLDKSK